MAEASAAIDEMLRSNDTAAAYREILVERRERESLFAGFESELVYLAGRGRSVIVQILTSPFVVIGNLAAVLFWLLSRLIASMGWIFSTLAIAIVWVLSHIGLLAGKTVSATVQNGREKVIPWIGAQDWRNMATGCRVQVLAAIRQVDALLSRAAAGDRYLLQILRFATAAGAAIGAVAAAVIVF
jgi:hypothetical protein